MTRSADFTVGRFIGFDVATKSKLEMGFMAPRPSERRGIAESMYGKHVRFP